MTTKEVGDFAEQLAIEYLQGLGYELLEHQYKYKQLGEVDIVMKDAEVFTFVEVRFRTSTAYGTPEASLRQGKLRKVRKTAQMWLLTHGCIHKPCRFDVVAVDLVGGTPVIRHLRNAF